MAGNQRQGGPVKVSVVGSGGPGNSRVWRRERIGMTEPDLDDVAFLTGNAIRSLIVFSSFTAIRMHRECTLDGAI